MAKVEVEVTVWGNKQEVFVEIGGKVVGWYILEGDTWVEQVKK